MVEMGVEPKLYQVMVEEDKSQIRILSDRELVDLNLVNTIWKRDPWRIDLLAKKATAIASSQFGNVYRSQLAVSCQGRGKLNMTFGIRLPQNYINAGSYDNAEKLINKEIRIGANSDDFDNSEAFTVDKRYRLDDYIFADISSPRLMEMIENESLLYVDLYSDMVSARQYDKFEMMSPSFSLDQSNRAIRLIEKSCE